MSSEPRSKIDLISKWSSTIIAVLALFATFVNVFVARNSYVLNQETQKVALFSQFQQQYNSIAARFPDHLLDPDFRPLRNSDEYERLQAYWIFCFAQWFQTKRSDNSSYQELWKDYYSDLVLNAMDIPSLRYTLLDMFQTYGTNRREIQRFFTDLRVMAAQAGQPLISGDQTKPR